jgi:sugar phosphate isomerase/epimerase
LKVSPTPPLGIAHFTVIDVPPLELVSLAAKIGYAAIGLRLYPAFPGAPYYEIPARTTASREMQQRLRGEGVRIYDIEFVTISEDFVPSTLAGILDAASALGAQRLSVCGDDPNHSRMVAKFAELCDLAAGFGMGVDLECMAWRQVANFAEAIKVAEEAGRPNGGVLVDALHLSRTGGTPHDVRNAAAALIRSAQLCDAVAERPPSVDAIIKEARSGRLAPGRGKLPLCELLAALPAGTVLSVEVPMNGSKMPEQHARDIFDATQRLFASCGPADQLVAGGVRPDGSDQ